MYVVHKFYNMSSGENSTLLPVVGSDTTTGTSTETTGTSSAITGATPPRPWRRYLLCGMATACIVGGIALMFAAPAATPVGWFAMWAMVFTGMVLACCGFCGAVDLR